MAKYDSYVICTSPRSGSTLLCKLLAATGVAGNPQSYFYGTAIEDWLVDLDVLPDAARTERDALDAVVRAALHRGRNGTGVFGLRQQRHSFEFLCQKLAVLYPGQSDSKRMQSAFGSTLFVHLTREDKVAQAVSLLKAEQSGLWHVAPDGRELERIAPHREPVYDAQAISACIAALNAYDRDWNAWFSREGIRPVRISYDALSDGPALILRQLLDDLGLDCVAADGIVPGVRKLADDTSRNWIARFRAEQEASGAGPTKSSAGPK